jgi:transposase
VKPAEDEKVEFLRTHRALHPHPQKVRDETFQQTTFFDPRDLMQVRYEMLRRHRVEGRSVAETARAFGVSRQFFYLLAEAFEAEGLLGLGPRKRGPKRAHKCSTEVLDFVQTRRKASAPPGWGDLAKDVASTFGVRVHPRTLQRALARRKKNHPPAASKES